MVLVVPLLWKLAEGEGRARNIFGGFSRNLELRFFLNFVFVMFMILLMSSISLREIAEFSFFIIGVLCRYLFPLILQRKGEIQRTMSTSAYLKHQL